MIEHESGLSLKATSLYPCEVITVDRKSGGPEHRQEFAYRNDERYGDRSHANGCDDVLRQSLAQNAIDRSAEQGHHRDQPENAKWIHFYVFGRNHKDTKTQRESGSVNTNFD